MQVCGAIDSSKRFLRSSTKTHDPEELIREEIDALFVPYGWVERDKNAVNLSASHQFLATRETTTAGQSGILGGDLRDLLIPVAPLTEQQRIVAEVDRRLSVVEELEAVVNANLQRATRLRQSILQRGFEGKLFCSEKCLSDATIDADRIDNSGGTT